MKKYILIFAIALISLTVFSQGTQVIPDSLENGVYENTVTDAVSETVNGVANAITENPLPIDGTNQDWLNWILAIIVSLMPLILNWIARLIPTTSANGFKVLKLAEIIGQFLIKLGQAVPNKAKGGKTHKD